MKKKDQRIFEVINEYGRKILDSELFRFAGREVHHVHTSVSEHSLNVCILSMRISDLFAHLRLPVRRDDLVKASLCHDLGMIGRSDLYKNRVSSWRHHPENSEELARELIPDISENAASSVRTHMWPLTFRWPKTREARILVLADKAASFADWAPCLFNRHYKAALKERLQNAG